MSEPCAECARPLPRKKDQNRCVDCAAIVCDRHYWMRPDSANEAITKHAPWLCPPCYRKRYPNG